MPNQDEIVEITMGKNFDQRIDDRIEEANQKLFDKLVEYIDSKFDKTPPQTDKTPLTNELEIAQKVYAELSNIYTEHDVESIKTQFQTYISSKRSLQNIYYSTARYMLLTNGNYSLWYMKSVLQLFLKNGMKENVSGIGETNLLFSYMTTTTQDEFDLDVLKMLLELKFYPTKAEGFRNYINFSPHDNKTKISMMKEIMKYFINAEMDFNNIVSLWEAVLSHSNLE